MPGPYLWADEHVELEGNTMNPDHADENDQCDDMPRAVEHALRKHGAMDDELCRTVAGEVWQDMQADYDRAYEHWQDAVRTIGDLQRERDRLREYIRDASHEYACKTILDWHLQEGGYRVMDDSKCNCWKRAALEGKP
jgi:hypothetical protein